MRRRQILYDAGLHVHRVLITGARVFPAGLGVGFQLVRCRRAGICRWIDLGEGLIDRRHVVADVLRLGKQLLGLADRLVELRQCRVWQAGEIFALVDEHRGLVFQALDFIIDLLKFSRGGQHVLGKIARIKNRDLRVGRHYHEPR